MATFDNDYGYISLMMGFNPQTCKSILNNTEKMKENYSGIR